MSFDRGFIFEKFFSPWFFFPEHYFIAVGGPIYVDILNHQNVSRYYVVNDNLYVFLILEKSDWYRLSHTTTCCPCRFILLCFLHQCLLSLWYPKQCVQQRLGPWKWWWWIDNITQTSHTKVSKFIRYSIRYKLYTMHTLFLF